MNKYIQDTIRNNSRAILVGLTKPQQKTVSEVIRGLFTAGKPILRAMAQDESKSAKKQGEKYAYHLNNIDITGRVNECAVRKTKQQMKKHTIIAYDLTDISKESAKKMENLRRVFDGSKRQVSNGYELHGVGVNNVMVRLEVHDDNRYTRNQVRRSIVESISQELNKKGIWVFDRGNDDRQFFRYLRHDAKLHFIARLKQNRTVVIKETGVIMPVKDLENGKYNVYLIDTQSYKVDTEFEYCLVVKKHLQDKPPIRLLTSLANDSYSIDQLVTMYLERWGVENIFKRVKQKFQLEKIRVINYQKFINLISLIHFAMVLASTLYINIQKFTHTLIVGLVLCYKQFIRKKCLSFNIDSFISYLQVSLEPLIYRQHSPPIQPTLFSKHQLEKLGSF